jgi:nitrate reductase delta subunit
VTRGPSGRLCAQLADLLSYPRGDPGAEARDALTLAEGAGRAPLARFAAAAGEAGLGALQELYTATFDLRPACAPYVGAQLLPEDSPVRGRLLAALLDLYESERFRPREELADHVAEILRFLATARPGPERDGLIEDGLIPTVDRMIAVLDAGNPYRDLLTAVRALFVLAAASSPPVRVAREGGAA